MIQSFTYKIEDMTDINTLVSLKEKIKNQVMDQQLTWQERAYLYQKVQSINERIELIQNQIA